MPNSTVIEQLVLDTLAGTTQEEDSITVEGITCSMVFNTTKIEAHKNEIRKQLSTLPTEFYKDEGGGWSFLNACLDNEGNQWGEHLDMHNLFCLGIAAGLASWLLPRDMWKSFPGGMPYVVVDLDKKG